MKYEMTKDLETGNAMIDKEHKELFDAVNRLLDSCSKGQGRAAMDGAIQFLVNYVINILPMRKDFSRARIILA